jgi:hypothetical protein
MRILFIAKYYNNHSSKSIKVYLYNININFDYTQVFFTEFHPLLLISD